MECDEAHPHCEQFTVVEETVLTQGESPEDSTTIVITWGRLIMKVTDKTPECNNQDLQRLVEHETKKIDNENKFTQTILNGNCMSEKKGRNKCVKLLENCDNNICVNIESENEDINKSIEIGEFEDILIKSKGKRIPLYVIDEDSCIIEESAKGWTNNIPILRENEQNEHSIKITEIEESYELNFDEQNSENISPIVDEEFEMDDENTKQTISEHQIDIEEIDEPSEHTEITVSYVIQDFEADHFEKEMFNSNPEKREIIHFGFLKCLEHLDDYYEEYIPDIPKEETISCVSYHSANNYLTLFSDVMIENTDIDSEKMGGEDKEMLKSRNKKDEPPHISKKGDQESEERDSKYNTDNKCCKTKATSIEAITTNKQETYLFIFLMFLLFLLTFYLSTSSAQDNSCDGQNNGEKTSSCALDGYVELSWM